MATLGRIELKSLITKNYRYDQINEALADLEHGKLAWRFRFGTEFE